MNKHNSEPSFAQVLKELLKPLMRCNLWPKSRPREGRNSSPSRNSPGCLQEHLPPDPGGWTSQKAFLQRHQVPTRFMSHKQGWIPSYKTTEVTSAPLSANGNVQRIKIKKKKKKSRTIGMSGEQHIRECKPPLAQSHYIQVFLGLIQLRFEDHQEYPFLTINSSIKAGIWAQLQRNTQRQRKT